MVLLPEEAMACLYPLLGTKGTRKASLYTLQAFSLTLEHFRCNKHILGLGQRVKESLTKAGIIGYQFGTVGVSDAISMGTEGMSFSLQSRDLIADQVETAAGGHWLDGMVVVPGCDKNMPGVLMARECCYFTFKVRLLRETILPQLAG